MKHALLVDAAVGVGAEVIALGLQQIGRQAGGAVAVVVGQRGRECRHGNAAADRRGHHVTPRALGLFHSPVEISRQEQIFQLRVGVEGLLDAFQEHGAG